MNVVQPQSALDAILVVSLLINAFNEKKIPEQSFPVLYLVYSIVSGIKNVFAIFATFPGAACKTNRMVISTKLWYPAKKMLLPGCLVHEGAALGPSSRQ